MCIRDRRETSILKRQLVTTGKLRQIPRTENNPHGLIITDWKTILNKDLDYNCLLYTSEKEDEKKESEQNYVSVNESIEMDVETQGIPMEQLLAKDVYKRQASININENFSDLSIHF